MVSIIYVALWGVAVFVVYVDGPMWLSLLLGLLAFALALCDRVYVRAKAREALFGKRANDA